MQCVDPWKANRGEVSGNSESGSGRLLVVFFRSGAQCSTMKVAQSESWHS